MCNNSLERVNLEIEFKTILQTGQEIMKYNGYNLFVEKHLYKNFENTFYWLRESIFMCLLMSLTQMYATVQKSIFWKTKLTLLLIQEPSN